MEYVIVGVSLSEAKCIGGEYSNESRKMIYFTNVCAHQITGI